MCKLFVQIARWCEDVVWRPAASKPHPHTNEQSGRAPQARDGLLPAPLARLSRHHTPLGGNILILSVTVLLLLLTVLTKGDPSAVFGTMSTIGSLVIEVIYIALAIVAIRFVRENSAQWWHWIALLVAIVTSILGIYGSAIVLAAIWAGMIAFFFPKRLAAIVDSATASDEPPSEQEVVQAD